MKLLLTPQAQPDLLGIRKYIENELQSPQAAQSTVEQITKRLRTLTDFPGLGTPLSSIINTETDYRYLVCKNHKAFYRFNSEAVYIIRILHNRRDFVKILFGETKDTNNL